MTLLPDRTIYCTPGIVVEGIPILREIFWYVHQSYPGVGYRYRTNTELSYVLTASKQDRMYRKVSCRYQDRNYQIREAFYDRGSP